ncbi:MAG: hypothetical protein ACXVIJ_00550 [Thermoanaerobaculia bacterium]
MIPGLVAHVSRGAERVPALAPFPQTANIEPGALEPTVRVQYPRLYDDLLVAEFGGERVVLRAVGANTTLATETGRKLGREAPGVHA